MAKVETVLAEWETQITDVSGHKLTIRLVKTCGEPYVVRSWRDLDGQIRWTQYVLVRAWNDAEDISRTHPQWTRVK